MLTNLLGEVATFALRKTANLVLHSLSRFEGGSQAAGEANDQTSSIKH
jgi:hypothetical protein